AVVSGAELLAEPEEDAELEAELDPTVWTAPPSSLSLPQLELTSANAKQAPSTARILRFTIFPSSSPPKSDE
ncbi:MAG: hypothetical protein QGF73_05370, partial [Acidimicrobiales bacterium]|nr:hypothetical protein [Acidimicrobiales bacterium]